LAVITAMAAPFLALLGRFKCLAGETFGFCESPDATCKLANAQWDIGVPFAKRASHLNVQASPI
jgi:hypothetical protein